VGGTAHRLQLPGGELCITSDEALELTECPKKVGRDDEKMRMKMRVKMRMKMRR
jgi:hypothetical protein